MNMKPVIIGDIEAKYPIIQGGMGVGVSRWRLAGTVAREGGIGIISNAQIRYDKPDFQRQQIPSNLKTITKHIDFAKGIAVGGIMGVKIKQATKQY